MTLYSYQGELFHQTKDKRVFKLEDMATPHLINTINSLPENSKTRDTYVKELRRREDKDSIQELEPAELTLKFHTTKSELPHHNAAISMEMIRSLAKILKERDLPFIKYSAKLGTPEDVYLLVLSTQDKSVRILALPATPTNKIMLELINGQTSDIRERKTYVTDCIEDLFAKRDSDLLFNSNPLNIKGFYTAFKYN